MKEIEPTQSDDTRLCWVASESFAAYAETDLDRWRQMIHQQVQHRDPRWGVGEVEAVTWGSCCEHVPAYVQIKIRYDGDLTVTANSDTWHEHHARVSVSTVVEQAIRTCLDPAFTPEEQSDCLLRHARELREQQDQQALDRAAQRKQRNTKRPG